MHCPPMLERVVRIHGNRPGGEEISEIVRQAASLSKGERVALVRWLHKALWAPQRSLSELERVGLVKTMVALLPESARTLRGWITSTTPETAEVRFTIFCYLDHVPSMENGRDLSREIPSLVEEFLLNVPSDAGRAAWMAGDLLGDHWNLSSALPVLLRVAIEGRFVAGRESAVHGLCHAMERASQFDRERIRTTLRGIRKRDRSLRVRNAALQVQEGRSPCSPHLGSRLQVVETK